MGSALQRRQRGGGLDPPLQARLRPLDSRPGLWPTLLRLFEACSCVWLLGPMVTSLDPLSGGLGSQQPASGDDRKDEAKAAPR